MTNSILASANKEQKKLIILQKITCYCRKNNTNKIRFNELRAMCDEYLDAYSGGYQTNMGGNFDKLVTELQSEGFLEREKISPKRTFLIPDMLKIESYLQKNKLKKSLDNMNSVVKQILGDSSDEGSRYPFDIVQKARHLVDSVPASEMLGMKVIRVESKDFLKKDAGPGLSATLESNLVDISSASNTNALTINKETAIQLLELIQQIIAQNKVSPSFMVILRYNGIPSSLHELIKSERYYDFYHKLSDYFVEWLEHFEKYEIGQEDKNSLFDGKIEDLSEHTKDKLKVFLQDLIDNTPKDNILTPILSGICQKISNDDSD
jgi:hypothetical protein